MRSGSWVRTGDAISNRLSASAGVFQASVFRGRELSAAATAATASALCMLRSVPFGKYWRSSPLVFSFVPRRRALFGIAGLFALASGMVAMPIQARAADQEVLVFAAASLKNALDDVIAAYGKESGTKVIASYAASSALAKQIEQGAPARLFISADLDWMDYLEQRHLILDATRKNLLGNSLVLVAGRDSGQGEVAIGQG